MLRKTIKCDILFYEKALLNPKGTQAASCKQQYGRSWKKMVMEEIEKLEQLLKELDTDGEWYEQLYGYI